MSTFLNDKINARNELSTSEIVRIHVFTKIEKELAPVEPLVTVT